MLADEVTAVKAANGTQTTNAGALIIAPMEMETSSRHQWSPLYARVLLFDTHEGHDYLEYRSFAQSR